MDKISKQKITNAFDFLYLANNVNGSHGIIPPEGLNTCGSGFNKMVFDTVYNIVGIIS